MLANITLFVVLGLVAAQFYNWAAESADIVERNVMHTTAYSISGAMIVNLVCAGVVRGVKAVPPGEEMGACSPYGLIGAGITARLHLFWLSGYKHGEWSYIADTPSRTLRFVDRGVDAARIYVEEELAKLGVLGKPEVVVEEKSEL